MNRICLVVLAMLFVLGGCATVNGGAPSVAPSVAPSAEPTPSAAPASSEPSAVAATQTAASEGSFSEKDLVFTVDGLDFQLKTDIKPLLAKLGDGYEMSEAVSCVYVGMDRTFTYPGITIYTFPTDNVDYVDEIVLTDNTHKTPKGVAVGDTLEDIVAAYGSGYKDDGGMIIYITGSDPDDLRAPRLYFTMTDGKVDSIGFYSASNIQEQTDGE